jgi:hypothetical protein
MEQPCDETLTWPNEASNRQFGSFVRSLMSRCSGPKIPSLFILEINVDRLIRQHGGGPLRPTYHSSGGPQRLQNQSCFVIAQCASWGNRVHYIPLWCRKGVGKHSERGTISCKKSVRRSRKLKSQFEMHQPSVKSSNAGLFKANCRKRESQ